VSFLEEIIVCYKSASHAIAAEQALAEGNFSVGIMPAPSVIQAGCGFCLRFLPEDFVGAAALLSERGLSVSDAYLRRGSRGEGRPESFSYEKIPLGD